jgi:hypothetical protein
MSSNYRLRTGCRDANGVVTRPIDDVVFRADTTADAINAARNYPVSFFVGAGDYAWLTDESERVVWSLKLEEVSS